MELAVSKNVEKASRWDLPCERCTRSSTRAHSTNRRSHDGVDDWSSLDLKPGAQSQESALKAQLSPRPQDLSWSWF